MQNVGNGFTVPHGGMGRPVYKSTTTGNLLNFEKNMSSALITVSGTILVLVLLWDFLKTIVKNYKLNIFPRDGKLFYIKDEKLLPIF